MTDDTVPVKKESIYLMTSASSNLIYSSNKDNFSYVV
jgi:hypothetical protein